MKSSSKILVALFLVFLLISLAATSNLRNIEDITPLNSQIDVNGSLDLQSNRIEDLANPDSGDDAMPRSYADNRYLERDGNDYMNGDLNMNENNIDNAYDIFSSSGGRVLLRAKGSGGTLGWYDDNNNNWVIEHNNGGDIDMRPTGNDVDLNDNDLHDVRNIMVNNIYDADGGNQIEVQDQLDLNNNNLNGLGTLYGYSNNDIVFNDRPKSNDGLYIDAGTSYFDEDIRVDTIKPRSDSTNTIILNDNNNVDIPNGGLDVSSPSNTGGAVDVGGSLNADGGLKTFSGNVGSNSRMCIGDRCA